MPYFNYFDLECRTRPFWSVKKNIFKLFVLKQPNLSKPYFRLRSQVNNILQSLYLMSSEKASSLPFKGLFNLHPQDALLCYQSVYDHLETFTQSFKERIEIEIQYSKSLIRVSKQLSKHINAQKPSPLSYFSSAFKVEHEQRARHALELAQYLHSEIQVPCQNLLQESRVILKQAEKELRSYYKQGESVEELYKKNLKKFFRSRQEWEQKLMNKIMSSQVPGLSPSQLQKLRTKLYQQKEETYQFQNRYLKSLEAFNKFAEDYNQRIEIPLQKLQDHSLQQLALESDSLRKLIVSEVNMFKNIEYDLLNISRQMESLSPQQQLEIFTKDLGSQFKYPIISIYSQGPIAQSGYTAIDYKVPISASLLQKTLLGIEGSRFGWMLENKFNSTLRFCLQQAWKKFSGLQTEDFMPELEECISNNKVVEGIPLDKDNTLFLSKEDVFSIAFSIVCTLGGFVSSVPLDTQKQEDTIHSLSGKLSLHHFYRFIAITALEQLLVFKEYKLHDQVEITRLVMVLRLLLEQCFQAKDIFVLRSIVCLMFSTEAQFPLIFKQPLKDLDFWNDNDVWESMIFEGTFEEISLLPSVTKAELKQVYLMRQKNVMFSALATYCHYMAMMGCETEQIQSLASRFCHVYGLYQEHRRDLGRVIKNSSQKYRQAASQIQSSSSKDRKSDFIRNSLKLSSESLDKELIQNKEQIQNNTIIQAEVVSSSAPKAETIQCQPELTADSKQQKIQEPPIQQIKPVEKQIPSSSEDRNDN